MMSKHSPLAVPPIVEGSHGHIAERFRQEALDQLRRVTAALSMMDFLLRMEPDDTDQLAEWSRVAGAAEVEFNLAAMMFWETRTLVGDA